MDTQKVSPEVVEQNPTLTPEEALIQEAKDRFTIAQDHWKDFHEDAEDCLLYVKPGNDYMDQRYIANREAAGLPILSENRIAPLLDHNVNEFKQNIPSIQVDPANNETSQDFAQQIADLVRTIEYDSNAKDHYGKAGWYSIGTGLGFCRVVNDYVNDDSFEQELRIEAIDNPFTVFLDPEHRDSTGCDSEYAFIVTSMTHDEYIRRYADSRLASELRDAKISGWTAYNQRLQTSASQWLTPSLVMVAEYFKKEYSTYKLYRYFDKTLGAMKTTKDLDTVGSNEIDDVRDVETYVWKHYVLNDKEILDENEWGGPYLPIVAFKGTEYWNQSRRHLFGIIQAMRSPQKRFDYVMNWQTEMMMLQPKAPYIGTDTNFQNNRNEWGDLNHSNQAYITYQPDPTNQGVPPTRDLMNFDISSSQTVLANAAEGFRAVSGMQGPMTGEMTTEQGPESGKAQLARITQSQISRFHDQANIRNSIAQIGRILVSAAPIFYSENGRKVVATKRNGDQTLIELNTDVDTMLKDKQFKVAVETGPTYTTRRQEAADKGLAAMVALPQQAPLFADIVFENCDWPGHKDIAARIRATVPPEVLAATEASNPTEGPQAIANLKAQVASLSSQLQQIQQDVEPDKIKIRQLEMEKSFATHDNTVDTIKLKLEHEYKMEELRIKEQEIIAKSEISRKELELAKAQLTLKERELGIKGVVAAADISTTIMDQHHKVKSTVDADIDVPGVSDEIVDTSKLDNVISKSKPTDSTSIPNPLGAATNPGS